MKASAFIASSLDGFIARENGEVDWLAGDDVEESNEDYGFQKFMDSVDALVMGRKTFEMVISSGMWAYGPKQVFVLTSTPLQLPEDFSGNVEALSGPPSEVVEKLTARGFKHIYVDGGQTIQGFINSGLIQRIIITSIPILIGTGIPLFGPINQDIRLKHIETQAFESGYVQSVYEVIY
jgi:dihydrofolate reductase